MRADELKAILALLDADYVSEEAAAQAIFDGVQDILGMRVAYGIGLEGVAWGPFYDLRTAKKNAEVIGGKVAKLYAPGYLTEKVQAGVVIGQHCQECQHPKVAHIEKKWTWDTPQRGKRQEWQEPGCCVPQCQCKTVFPISRTKR